MFLQILGPSPALYMARKIRSKILIRGGGDHLRQDVYGNGPDNYYTDGEFFDDVKQDSGRTGGTIFKTTESDTPRMSNPELNKRLANEAKKKYTPDQKLVNSVLQKVKESRIITQSDIQNLEELYAFRRRFKIYLRLKRLIPLGIVAPYTNSEVTKMTYAAALGSKSIALTLDGLVGLSLPAFFFFHMSYYYAPDKFKPICQLGKYTLGGPLLLLSTVTDGLLSRAEDKFLGQPVPIDIGSTGGTIPGDMGTGKEFKKFLKELEQLGHELGDKSY